MKVNTFVAVFVAFVTVTNAAERVLMCYYQSWTSLSANQLKEADKCTHMIYSFIKTTDNGNLEPDNEEFLQQFSTLKKLNPNMKLMVATGGWTYGTASFIAVASKPNVRKNYAQNVKKFLEKYNLDGFDLDWEFPNADDKTNFIELIKDLKATLGSEKILTAAVGATREHRDRSYLVSEMSRYLDYINVMTYDLNGGGNEFNAPLNMVKKSIDGWLQAGAEPGKLVLGTAFYGKSNGGQPVDYTPICKKIKSEGYIRTFNEQNKVPIIEKNGERINYDDMESLKLKADIVNKLNLGGAMVWSIEKDDKNNECGDGKFPLLNALSEGLYGKNSLLSNVKQKNKKTKKTKKTKNPKKPHRPIKPTQSPLYTTTTTRRWNPVADNNGPCNGFQADPNDCQFYYVCDAGQKFHMQCPTGTLFSKQTLACDHENIVRPNC